jgi:hypothetical protein
MSGKTLSSWKEIAKYLGRDESTVRRWEREKGLPVHRPGAGKGTSVYAYSDEINGWLCREKSSEPPISLKAPCGTEKENDNEFVQVDKTVADIIPATANNGIPLELPKAKKTDDRKTGLIITLFISMALCISIFGLFHHSFSGLAMRIEHSSNSVKSLPHLENDHIDGSAPQISDEMREKLIADAKRVVKQSQIWEMLSLYTAPWNCDAKDIERYWDAGSKAFVDVGESVSRLNERGWHYGYGSRLLNFEFLSAKISQDGSSAEIQTREHWLLPVYTREGKLVASRNADQGPYEIDYLLVRSDNHWYLKSTGTPYVAWKPKQISCKGWPNFKSNDNAQ